MAKLTARFDIQDNISKKLRAIRGEIDSLERARNNVNKPMLMRVKDQATAVLKRLHMFVLRDIAKTHMLIVQLKDQATKPLNALSNFMRRKMPKTHGMLVTANDKATSVMKKIGHYAKSNIIGVRMMQIRATDMAMPVIRRVSTLARSTLSRGYSFSVRAVDAASRVVGHVASYTANAIPRVRTFTIQAVNAASNIIGSIKNALFSIPTLITVTLAAVGIGHLKDATLGAAMRFEDYGVAMDHWLKGDKKASAELMDWMGKKADKTPFSSPDIFPAMTGAVALSGNDPGSIKRLTSAAIDMAALSGGQKSVGDAMQALTMAKMGNFVMMKGFGMQITKKDYNKMGWAGFQDHVESVFEGGAEALSKTASGILATLKGYRGSLLRTIGSGFLGPMKPRLDSINKWLENNQETWGRWKSVVNKHGEETSEFIFSRLEKSFIHLRSRYLDNKKFMELNFEGKIAFIMSDIGSWWSSKGKPALDGWWQASGKPWAATIGLTIGEAIFTGVVLGIQKGLGTIGEMWTDVGADVKENGINKETATSAAGAGAATLGIGALALGAASFVLTPVIKGIQAIGKAGGWAASKIKGKGSPGTRAEKPPKAAKVARASRPPHYTMPWTNQGERPKLNVPNARDTGFKLPKGFSSIGNFAKRIPILGTALGALAIATSSKEDKAGTVGAVGGGLAGAATGAALGSVVPVVGTLIGGIIGGVVGSLGGQAIGDWLSDNWTSIKDGASSTGKWISEKFGGAVGWVSDKWSGMTSWFSETIWTPLANGFDKTISFIVGLYDIAEQGIKFVWGVLSSWFTETVWTPLSIAASIAWDWISTKVSDTWLAVQTMWGMAVSWFQETIWTPLMAGAEVVGTWIGEKFSAGWNVVTAMWGVATAWFEETVWAPISTAAGVLGTFIGDKFTEGWAIVTEIWGIAGGYFEDNIWTPIKTGAGLVKDAIIAPFESAWEVVSGIFTKLGDTWDTIKQWGGKAVEWGSQAAGYVVERGEERRGITPDKNATGGHITKPTLSWVGEAGNEYVIPTQNNLGRGRMLLSQAANDLGMSVYDNGSSTVSQDQLAAVSSTGGSGKQSVGSKVRDIVVQITGENHYSDDMDAERVGRVAFEYVKRQLEQELFTGGEGVYDV